MSAERQNTKHVRHLSDGREIIYFDDEPGRVHQDDTRELPAIDSTSELRRDPTTGELVIIASHRQARTHLPAREACPLCPSSEHERTEIPDATYDVVVFENRFPSLSTGTQPAAGRSEVVCYSPQHEASLATCELRRIATVVDAWCDRTTELGRILGVRYVFVFENRGEEIGVTLSHPHGQIYAYPFIPPMVDKMIAAATAHRASHHRSLFADVVAAETAAERVVLASDHWIGFVPEAARWPVEVHIYPRRQIASIDELTVDERLDFAREYQSLLGRLGSLFDRQLPYIAAWYQAPVTPADHGLQPDDWWAHLRLMSIRRGPNKIKYLAGSESAMGVFINDIAPETMAEMINAVVPSS